MILNEDFFDDNIIDVDTNISDIEQDKYRLVWAIEVGPPVTIEYFPDLDVYKYFRVILGCLKQCDFISSVKVEDVRYYEDMLHNERFAFLNDEQIQSKSVSLMSDDLRTSCKNYFKQKFDEYTADDISYSSFYVTLVTEITIQKCSYARYSNSMKKLCQLSNKIDKDINDVFADSISDQICIYIKDKKFERGGTRIFTNPRFITPTEIMNVYAEFFFDGDLLPVEKLLHYDDVPAEHDGVPREHKWFINDNITKGKVIRI